MNFFQIPLQRDRRQDGFQRARQHEAVFHAKAPVRFAYIQLLLQITIYGWKMTERNPVKKTKFAVNREKIALYLFYSRYTLRDIGLPTVLNPTSSRHRGIRFRSPPTTASRSRPINLLRLSSTSARLLLLRRCKNSCLNISSLSCISIDENLTFDSDEPPLQPANRPSNRPNFRVPESRTISPRF